MSYPDFVHLRNHTAYSLLEGAIKISDLANKCKEMHMPAVAMTDTGNLFGALEFSETCAQKGVQPIIGCQLDVAPYSPKTGLGQTQSSSINNGKTLITCDQIVLLVQNKTGYKNLLELVSRYHLNTDEPNLNQLSLKLMEEFNDGLIALTGGPLGGVGRLLSEGQRKDAESLLAELKRIFNDRIYVELLRHGLEIERRIESELIELAYKYDLPLIATNECFFISKDMHEAHDALICISEGTYVDQLERRRLTPEHYLKTPQEMSVLFSDIPEAVSNTIIVAQRCAFMAETRDPLLPPAPKLNNAKQESDSKVLEELAKVGLEERIKTVVFDAKNGAENCDQLVKPYRERLQYELRIISEMEFSGYFLIVADFIRWAKSQKIPVGPGRGSGAGSVVAWALTITDLDPLKFGLLFERFLNPERVSMPDFDVDFCQERRDEVIRYVQNKYGSERVAQIITFGTLQPRAALRDVGRVLQMPYPQVDHICKLVPNNPANPVTLQQAIASESLLRKEIERDNQVARLVEIAGKLEGLYRHASTHAAGVVIGDRPLVQLIPLYRDPRSEMPVTQFAMKWAEASGLVKFDFLGLKTLTVIATTKVLLKHRGIELNIDNINFNNSATFAMLGRGETTGVFQLESTGMRDILRNMKPDSFEDIIAIVALFRPGPMDNIPSYIRRKHGVEKSDYLHPKLEPILKETYGIMIYQEQVMQIAQELAGYTLASADLLRRAMGKKIKSEMDNQRETFVAGSIECGVPESKATEIFQQISKFAGYGFNKSHAAAYALVAYQTAYLKANYPTEFIAASMTHDLNNTDKLSNFKQELDRIGITLLPPDINLSDAVFSVEKLDDDQSDSLGVRYALGAIKNVGLSAMESLVAERKEKMRFENLQDLISSLDSGVVNKRQLESLARAGAFDSLHSNRRQLYEGVSTIIRQSNEIQQEKRDDQISLFNKEKISSSPVVLPVVVDWAPMVRLKEEFEAVGFYLSFHPLDTFAESLKQLKIKSITEIKASKSLGIIRLAGVVISKTERTSQRGNKYAFLKLSDQTGVYEVIVFSELLSKVNKHLEPGEVIYIVATTQFKGETVRITAQDIHSLTKPNIVQSNLRVFVDDEECLPSLRDILSSEGKGNGEIILVSMVDQVTEVEVRLPKKYKVSTLLAQAVKAIPGVIDVQEN